VYYGPAFPQDHESQAQAMKALVKRNAARGIWLEDVPEPKVGLNDVLIRVKRTAICGTDLHIYLWDDWAARTIPCRWWWVTNSSRDRRSRRQRE
jgi:hypothetical protein